jgi:hypothetical protein
LLEKKALNVSSFAFLACSGALVKGTINDNSWANQQLGATTNSKGPYNLITFSFGGNDLGFSGRILDCMGFNLGLIDNQQLFGPNLGALRQIVAHRCSFTKDQLLRDIDLLKPKLKEFYKSFVDERLLLAPNGHIVIMGYPHIFAEKSDWAWPASSLDYCWGIHAKDAELWNTGVDRINTVIREAASETDAAHIHFVDVNRGSPSFSGHGLCTKQGGEWINPPTLLPELFHSLHLNSSGEQTYAQRAASEISRLDFGDGSQPTNPPSAPSAFQGYGISTSTIRLQWNDNSKDETGFRIENAAGIGRDAPASPSASSGYDWSGLSPGTTMCFRIRAVNSAGQSAWQPGSPSVCATTSTLATTTTTTTTTTPISSAPSAPSALQGYGIDDSTIRLQWSDNSKDETGFQIENAAGTRRDAPASASSASGFDWTGLSSGTTMCYRIRAVNASGESPWQPGSASACATTTKPAPERVTIDVSSTIGWNYTPIPFQKGETFTIEFVSGEWSVDYRNLPSVGPEGYDATDDADIYQPCKFATDLPYGRLLGSVGSQGVFSVGRGGTFTADASGSLALRINDIDQCLVDNDGSVRVTVIMSA